MSFPLFGALALAAVTVGSLHTLAPDHWVPFAALARSRGWSAGRTLRITLWLRGFGHVTVSALLGLAGLFFGLRMAEAFGRRMEGIAGVLLIGFGLAYAIWGLRRAAGRKLHGHAHAHYDHVHDPSRTTAGALFLIFSADPCVAVIPLLFAAAPLGAAPTLGIVLLYEVATWERWRRSSCRQPAVLASFRHHGWTATAMRPPEASSRPSESPSPRSAGDAGRGGAGVDGFASLQRRRDRPTLSVQR